MRQELVDWLIPGRKDLEWLAEHMKSDNWLAWEVVGIHCGSRQSLRQVEI